ncbi:MAG TPA: hypothetical protein VGQ96_00900 [Candidatus Eremiobacteraceae bacterium]|nr:hypothetical protein [Candidatus Eremiobacteraceae bacterium]
MAESSLGSLVVEISASTAKFTSALDKAAYQMNHQMGAMVASAHQLEKAMLKLDAVVGTFGTSLRGLFGIVAVVGLGKLVTSAIDAQAELGRLANRAGTTVEDLSSLRVAAHEGGVGLDEIALAMDRMAKALFEGQDKSTKAAIALQKIGLEAKNLVGLPTAQAFQVIATALNKFNESTTKTAVEMEIFSKSGPKMGAALKAVAEEGPAAVSVTTQMADAARQTEREFFKLSDRFSTLETAAANHLLPALNDVAKAFIAMQSQNSATLGFWDLLAEGIRLAALAMAGLYTWEKLAIEGAIGYVRIMNEIIHLRFDNIEAEWIRMNARIDEGTANLVRFYNVVKTGSALLPGGGGVGIGVPTSTNDRSAQYKGDPYYGQGPKKRDLTGGLGGGGSTDDPRKAELERVLKELEAFAAQEKLILQARDEFLKLYYTQGFVSEKQYYESRIQLMQEDLNTQVNTKTAELEAIDAYVAGLNKKKGMEKAIEEEEKKKVVIRQEINKLQIEAAKNVGLFELESREAGRLYEGRLQAINAELLALQGHTAQAAKITRDFSEVLERRRLAASGSAGALADLNESRARKEAMDRLTEATNRYSLVVQQVGLAQAAADLKFQAGNITELDAYRQRAEAARQMIPLLTAVADAAQREAEATKDPKALLAVQQMRLEIAKLAVDADALAKRFTDIFEGSFATFLTDIVGRTKTVKQAFLDMAKSIEQSISQIAAKNVAEQLFGKGGPLGGLGSMFAKAFGDKGAGSATADAALATLGTSATTGSAALLGFTSALTTASAAALSFSASAGAGGIGSAFFGGGGSGLGSILGPGGLFGFAEGTPFVQKDMLAFLHRGEAVIPAAMNKPSVTGSGGNIIHVTVNVPQGTSRATGDQIGAEAGAGIQRAMRKYG